MRGAAPRAPRLRAARTSFRGTVDQDTFSGIRRGPSISKRVSCLSAVNRRDEPRHQRHAPAWRRTSRVECGGRGSWAAHPKGSPAVASRRTWLASTLISARDQLCDPRRVCPRVGLLALQACRSFGAPLNRQTRPMASATIRNLDDDAKTRLRVRAAKHHRSMEEEVRIILRDAVAARCSCSRIGDHRIETRRDTLCPGGLCPMCGCDQRRAPSENGQSGRGDVTHGARR